MIKLTIISSQEYKSKPGAEKNDLCDAQISLRNMPIKDWPALKKQIRELVGDTDEAGE